MKQTSPVELKFKPDLMMKTLDELPTGASGVICKLLGGKNFTARLVALGLNVGAQVTVFQNYGHGPVIVHVRGSRVALGRGEAAKIQVEAV